MGKLKIRLAVAGLMLVFVFTGASVLSAAAAGLSEDLRVRTELDTALKANAHVEDEIIVKFKNDSRPYRAVKVPRGQVAERILAYRNLRNVEFAEPNYIVKALSVPNDPYYRYQWNFDSINMESAWDKSNGAGAVVAVVDTGIAYEDFTDESGIFKKAPDLANTSFVPGYDFVNQDEHPNDDYGHGTHVAGTIAQSTNNSLGVAGVAHGASLMPLKVLGADGSGTTFDIINAIYFAADNGADVVNMSLGGGAYLQSFQAAINYATDKGVIVVAAAGNEKRRTVSYPAAYENVIAVGATRYDGTKAPYSNYGTGLDIMAPGGDTKVDQNGDGYGDGILQNTFASSPSEFGYYFYQGTSMASPHVAATAALLVSYAQNSGLVVNPQLITDILLSSAKYLGSSYFYGAGLLDASAALDSLAGSAPVDNSAPTAVISSVIGDIEDEPVSFSASGSSDPDGDSLLFYWDFGDGQSASGENVSHTYSRGGAYNVSLRVEDGRGGSASDSFALAINEVNDAPVALIVGGDKNLAISEEAVFDGRQSWDEEGDALSYWWDFGDSSFSGQALASHSYSAAGTYEAVLYVSDSNASSSAKIKVTVAAEEADPILSISIDENAMRLGSRAIFSWVIAPVEVRLDNALLANALVVGDWRIVDGSSVTTGTVSGRTDSSGVALLQSPMVKKPGPGTSFTLTVTRVDTTVLAPEDMVSATYTYE